MTVEQVVTASLDAFQNKTVTVVPGVVNEEMAKDALKHQLRNLDKASKKNKIVHLFFCVLFIQSSGALRVASSMNTPQIGQ